MTVDVLTWNMCMIVGSRTRDIKSLWFRWGHVLISFSAMVEELSGANEKRSGAMTGQNRYDSELRGLMIC